MATALELAAAVDLATGRRWPAPDPSQEARVAAAPVVPVVGLALGAVAAGAAAAVDGLGASAAAVLATLTLALGDGGSHRRPIALAARAVELVALARFTPPARSIALVVAPLLARWACVVQCYGGTP